jgi:hypothetical protein
MALILMVSFQVFMTARLRTASCAMLARNYITLVELQKSGELDIRDRQGRSVLRPIRPTRSHLLVTISDLEPRAAETGGALRRSPEMTTGFAWRVRPRRPRIDEQLSQQQSFGFTAQAPRQRPRSSSALPSRSPCGLLGALLVWAHPRARRSTTVTASREVDIHHQDIAPESQRMFFGLMIVDGIG